MRYNKRGFTLIEVLVVIGVLSLLVAISLPAVMNARSAARRAHCANNLRQFGIGLAAYHDAYSSFPVVVLIGAQSKRYSAHAMLLPFLGEQAVWEKLNFEGPGGWSFPDIASDSTPNAVSYDIALFKCPDDGVAAARDGANNYRFCTGPFPRMTTFMDGIANDEADSPRGPMESHRTTRQADVVDGLSATCFMSERVVGDHDRDRYDPFRDIWTIFEASGTVNTAALPGEYYELTCGNPPSRNPRHVSNMGTAWATDGALSTTYNHVFAPNSTIPDCALSPSRVRLGYGPFTARSLHSQSVNLLFGDGSVRGATREIDDRIWRAWATIDGGETIDDLSD